MTRLWRALAGDRRAQAFFPPSFAMHRAGMRIVLSRALARGCCPFCAGARHRPCCWRRGDRRRFPLAPPGVSARMRGDGAPKAQRRGLSAPVKARTRIGEDAHALRRSARPLWTKERTSSCGVCSATGTALFVSGRVRSPHPDASPQVGWPRRNARNGRKPSPVSEPVAGGPGASGRIPGAARERRLRTVARGRRVTVHGRISGPDLGVRADACASALPPAAPPSRRL